MICESCKKEDKKSYVYEGCTNITLAYTIQTYDENGKLLPSHNPNTITKSFNCSNGHSWTITS